MEVGNEYDRIASVYDACFQRTSDLVENEIVRRLLMEHVGSSVLDLGCGTGMFLDLIPFAGIEYVGFDVSRGMIAQARYKHPGHQFFVVDVQRTPWPIECRYDTIVSLFISLSHCRELSSVAGEMARCLAPGGHVFLMFLAPLGFRVSKLWDYLPACSNRVYKRWTSRQLRELFSFLDDVQIRGLSIPFVSSILDRLSYESALRYLSWETETIAKWLPSLCQFYVLTGTG